jgi:hypothetical protein
LQWSERQEITADPNSLAQALINALDTLFPNQGLEDSAAQNIEKAVDTWFNQVHPSSDGGEWVIGLTLYSALETAQRPLFNAELFYRIQG